MMQACFKQTFPLVTLYTNLGEDSIIHGINQTEVSPQIISVANSWQKISARFTKKFGRSRKSSAAHNYLFKRLIILSFKKIPAAAEEGKCFFIIVKK
jgi:hypothetical protein